MTKPYPKEFRDDVVQVARNREPGVGLEQIAKAKDTTLTGRPGRGVESAGFRNMANGNV